jgi:hypothetical protein
VAVPPPHPIEFRQRAVELARAFGPLLGGPA